MIYTFADTLTCDIYKDFNESDASYASFANEIFFAYKNCSFKIIFFNVSFARVVAQNLFLKIYHLRCIALRLTLNHMINIVLM